MSQDELHMRTALALAARGLGGTWPNPSVGCVIVRDGRVIGRGRTGLRGRPHAETQALAQALAREGAQAGAALRGATAYVTLEPCSHTGQTPPCAAALVAAGVVRVVVAAGDPDPRVNGSGFAMLRAGGVAVQSGFMAEAAAETLAGFFMRVRQGRPLVTLKLASTLDGRIATHAGESRWITGPVARRQVQALRGRHDAVMVGADTLAADDPDLTCRLAGYAHRPTVRIVADSRLRTRLSSRIVATAHQAPSWILYHTDSLPEDANLADAKPGEIVPSRAQRLAEAGARCILVPAAAGGAEVPGADGIAPGGAGGIVPGRVGEIAPGGAGGIDLAQAMRALGTRGLTRVLVEGGARLAANLLRADLVDRLVWFHAPGVIGGDGIPALWSLGVDGLADMPRFARIGAPCVAGEDVMTEFARI